MTGIRISLLEPTDYPRANPDLAALLVDAVESGASVSFLGGLDLARAAAWWQDRTSEIERGVLVLVVARDAGQIVGCAGLVPAQAENSAHRGEVVKVLVLRSHRRRGIASAILPVLERAALARGHWLLVLDAVADGAGVELYRAHGWRDVGVVPDFARATDGRLEATRYMWKRLDP